MMKTITLLLPIAIFIAGCSTTPPPTPQRTELQYSTKLAKEVKALNTKLEQQLGPNHPASGLVVTSKSLKTFCATRHGLATYYFDYSAGWDENGKYAGILQGGYNILDDRGMFVSYERDNIGQNCQISIPGWVELTDSMLEEAYELVEAKKKADKEAIARAKREKFNKENPHIVKLRDLGSDVYSLDQCAYYGLISQQTSQYIVADKIKKTKQELGKKYDADVVHSRYKYDKSKMDLANSMIGNTQQVPFLLPNICDRLVEPYAKARF
ncbi:hypothetical protein [Vibrio breoganii]|uniref:hypothetical protein n=1 Tax=Vibrio breoganii TaxID=553239 RepID=UPI0021C47502|nr:hypothetical protein [Vibrio breoganii]MDN3716976.1 hypothetical protein [Vibrio breoganii]